MGKQQSFLPKLVMTQPESEPPKAKSRKSDPETSKAAAEKVDVNTCETIFLARMQKIGRIATAYEIAHGSTYKNPETIRKRAGGLKKKGLIEVVDKRGLSPSGCRCERLRLTDKGKARLGL